MGEIHPNLHRNQNGITSMGNSRFNAQSDTEAAEYVKTF